MHEFTHFLQEAEKSIRFYQNIKETTDDANKLVKNEIEKLKRQIEVKQTNESNRSKITWTDLTTNPGRKAMIIATVLAFVNHFSGAYTLIVYAATIFEEAGSIFSASESALFIGAIQLSGTCTLPWTVELFGRKVSQHF